jgi:hypothetical protein
MSTTTLPPNPNNYSYYTEGVGWYNSGGDDGFSAFLHNPWGFPSDEEKIAIKIAKDKTPSKSKTTNKYLYEYLFKYLGNRQENQSLGLSIQFNKLKTDVINTNSIGLILYGADINNIEQEISKYTTQNNKEITLTVNSICQCLITEYIKKENVEQLCRDVPGFDDHL